MKKLFLSAALLISSLQIFAQRPTSESYMGLKFGAGPSINFLSDSSFAGYNLNYKIGFSGGLYYNISLAEKFSVQPELLYSQMGSKLELKQDEGNNATLDLGYVSMPILFKFSPVDRLVFFAGPELQVLSYAKINYDSGPSEDLMSQLQTFDPAVTVGLEFWITKNIGIYARDIYGFGDLNKKDPGVWINGEFITSTISNFTFQAGLTIGFPSGQSGSEVNDADGDSIVDRDDLCPYVRGTGANFGCPEMVLHYNNDDATLDSTDKSNLDMVVDFLKSNPKLKIIIEGYTSMVGDSNYNQALSEKRANASLDYIASKGISKKRLQAIGYGNKNPLGDNATEEGQAMNRRVVIRIAK